MAKSSPGTLALITVLALLSTSFCLADDVKIHQSGDVDISSLRTYHVISKSLEETEGPLAEIMFPALHDETDVLLGREGFEASDEPDFLIAFQGAIIDHLDIEGGYQQHVGENFVVESWSPAYRKSTSDEIFSVMMMVPGDKEPFWIGTEIIGLGYHMDPEAATNRSAKALKKILKHFPPE